MDMHNFEVKTYTSPTNCSLCDSLLVGLTRQGHQCSICKLNVHSRCLESAKCKLACLNTKQTDATIPIVRVNEEPKKFHSFTVHTFIKPTFCAVCHKLLPGIFKQGFQCSACKLAVHQSCSHAALSSIECDPSRYSPTQISGMNLSSARKNFQAAVRKGMRRLGSAGANEEVREISAPTNFKHVAGTSAGRVLISLEEARKLHGNVTREPEQEKSQSTGEGGSGSGDAELVSTVEGLTLSEDSETLSTETKVSESTSLAGNRGEQFGKGVGAGGRDGLPPGWVELFDESSKQPYYFNESRFITQWERPEC